MSTVAEFALSGGQSQLQTRTWEGVVSPQVTVTWLVKTPIYCMFPSDGQQPARDEGDRQVSNGWLQGSDSVLSTTTSKVQEGGRPERTRAAMGRVVELVCVTRVGQRVSQRGKAIR